MPCTGLVPWIVPIGCEDIADRLDSEALHCSRPGNYGLCLPDEAIADQYNMPEAVVAAVDRWIRDYVLSRVREALGTARVVVVLVAVRCMDSAESLPLLRPGC